MDMLKKYKAVADCFKNKIIGDSRVEGIAYLGGLARNFADEFSDIDVAVFSSEEMPELRLGEQETSEGYDLEVFNIVMSEGFENWTAIQKEAYEESVIVADKRGKTAEFLKSALNFSYEYRTKRALEIIFEIAWHGWTYTPFKITKEKGYNWILPEDLWFRRGEPNNAYYVAQKSIDHFLELLFVLNRKWSPDYKWRYLKCIKLPVLPAQTESKLEFLLFEAWNEQTWQDKRKMFQELLDETIEIFLPDLPRDNWYNMLEH